MRSSITGWQYFPFEKKDHRQLKPEANNRSFLQSLNPWLWLIKPHPFIFNRYSVTVPGAITFLILVLFRPFGFALLGWGMLLGLALLFAAAASFSVWAVVHVLQYLSPRSFHEDAWTVGKELALILIVMGGIAALVFLFFVFMGGASQGLWPLLEVVIVRTLAISLLPILVMVLFEQYHYQKKQRLQAQKLNKRLQRQHGAAPSGILQIEAENGKIALQLAPDEIIYLKSEGNYVEVFFLHTGKIEKKLVRNRLKVLEDKLPSSTFFRCHKSYVVNIGRIRRIEGNARNFELLLQGSTERIPVSRSKSSELKAILKAYA